MKSEQVKQTAFFKMLIEMNDRQAIASAIATEILSGIETGFLVMELYGYEKDKIKGADIYAVADEIIKLKK